MDGWMIGRWEDAVSRKGIVRLGMVWYSIIGKAVI